MISGLRPPDGATIEDTVLILFWPRTNYAISYDVYFGDNFDDVNTGTQSTFVGNQTATSTVVGHQDAPYPDELVPGTTYYWRIDEVNEVEPDSPWKGYIWKFTVRMNYDFTLQHYKNTPEDTPIISSRECHPESFQRSPAAPPFSQVLS